MQDIQGTIADVLARWPGMGPAALRRSRSPRVRAARAMVAWQLRKAGVPDDQIGAIVGLSDTAAIRSLCRDGRKAAGE